MKKFWGQDRRPKLDYEKLRRVDATRRPVSRDVERLNKAGTKILAGLPWNSQPAVHSAVHWPVYVTVAGEGEALKVYCFHSRAEAYIEGFEWVGIDHDPPL